MSNNFCFGNTGINLSEKEYSIIRQFQPPKLLDTVSKLLI